jgi:pyridinium-3,5-biscarboxylic acid mononucleotide synthase
MDLRNILLDYYNNKKSLDEVIKSISLFSVEYIESDVAQIDINRDFRKSIPEIILASRKKSSELVIIINRILEKKGYVLVSKIRPLVVRKLVDYYDKKGFIVDRSRNGTSLLIYDSISSLPVSRGGKVGIICAGTSDVGIAEEARLATLAMGCTSYLAYDVGIAGIHRLLNSLKQMVSSDIDVIVAVAGMEGALPAVVTSLVSVPVIGVPCSVGYGYGDNGTGALASMLQTCSFGLSVVNIDNGIGGGIFASIIANKGR